MIPSEVGQLVKLQADLQLSYNSLTGNPELHSQAYPHAPPLLTESCLACAFRPATRQGSIPSEIGKLKQMRTNLLLNANSLHGTLPSELFHLTNFLDTVRHCVHRAAPQELNSVLCLVAARGSASSLVHFVSARLSPDCPPPPLYPAPLDIVGSCGSQYELQDNYLCGSVPSEIAGMIHLTYLGLNDNSLCGEMPESFDLADNLGIADNWNLYEG